MNLKSLGPGNWVDFLRSTLLLLILVGGTLAAAGDFRWLTIEDHNRANLLINQKITLATAEQTKALKAVTAAQQKLAAGLAMELARFRINDLDAQITFLQIKVEQGEASKSEEIILPGLERQLRELKRQAGERN